MQLFFDHICGKQNDMDFLHMLVSATFEPHEHQWALDNGWTPSNIWYSQNTNFKEQNETIWYQSRQSRINLEKYQETASERRTRKKAKNPCYKVVPFDFDIMYPIYVEYMNYRDFGDMLTSKEFCDYYDDDKLIFIMYEDVAISILEVVGESLLAHQFIWNYHNPKLGFGSYATYVERKFAEEMKLKYLYLGPSYETAGTYKSKYSGFEFWTGRKWSDDIETYKKLLAKDEELIDITGLTSYYNTYFGLLSV